MKSIAIKIIFPILLFFSLKSHGQVAEVNLFFGNQILNINQLNDWENTWDLDPIQNAFSMELSANFYPIKNKSLVVQTGLKYHKVRSQIGTVEFVKELLDLSDPKFGMFKYGFDLQYFIFQLSPTIKFNLNRSLNLTLGIGLLTHLTETKQQGFQVYVDPIKFTSITSQYIGKYREFGVSYNLSSSISKDLSNKLAITFKLEYMNLRTTIGEESESAFYNVQPNKRNITVPIHKQKLNLSGINMLVGVSFKINKN